MDCITVSMFPFKACIEDQLQRLADALTVSLRNAVLSNFKAVDAFLEDSMEKLGRRPRTIDDIGEVNTPGSTSIAGRTCFMSKTTLHSFSDISIV